MLWQVGVVNSVVTRVTSSLGVYQKEVTDGNTINNRAIKYNRKQDAAIRCARGDLT